MHNDIDLYLCINILHIRFVLQNNLARGYCQMWGFVINKKESIIYRSTTTYYSQWWS